MPHEATEIAGTDPVEDRSRTKVARSLAIAPPVADDAAEIHALIAACPPLDGNSLYANLIQCTHFAASCAVARLNGKVVGWISGHRPPGREDTYFLWQVAVHPDARGTGLPKLLLRQILDRPEQTNVRQIETSITRANEASWALFRSIAKWLGAPMADTTWFDRDQHLAGAHDSEFLVTIGPFAPSQQAG